MGNLVLVMKKNVAEIIVEDIKPLLETPQEKIKRKDLLQQKVVVNRAIAFFTQELINCSKAGQIVINSERYGELLMYALNEGNYSMYCMGVELLQWYMYEHSKYAGTLWAMTVLLEHINDLKAFEELLDISIIHEAMSDINTQNTKKKAEKRAE